ncbi:MAG: hypothetical protein M3Q48_02710 [Actinomycetota bacterium]|nr:hypothetical protein [Actinomycetota bacterium]
MDDKARHTGGEIIDVGAQIRPERRVEVIYGLGAGTGASSPHAPLPAEGTWLKGGNIRSGGKPHGRRTEISLPPLPAPGPHLLRVLEGAVIDFPAPVLHPRVQRWAATCWPDDAQPGGWGRALWWTSPYSRGFLPVALDYADVVEFAADIPVRRWGTTRWWPRWYGVVVEETPRGLVVYGPYPHPGAAKAVGDELRSTLAHHHARRLRN